MFTLICFKSINADPPPPHAVSSGQGSRPFRQGECGGGGICLNCVSHVNDNLECEGGGGEGGGLSHKPQYTLTHMYKYEEF